MPFRENRILLSAFAEVKHSKEDNMEVARSVIALAIGMAVLIVLIMKTKFHPALALVTGACVVGVCAGVEWAAIPGLITSGFGNTLASIGLVIAFGCMMGQIMEESNAAKVMAHTFIKALHGKNEEIALGITGFLVSIPIFADSALIILSPLIKSISQVKKKSLTGLALATACCLNITHASVPPTPGPLAVVAQFGDAINLGSYILFGIAMGIPWQRLQERSVIRLWMTTVRSSMSQAILQRSMQKSHQDLTFLLLIQTRNIHQPGFHLHRFSFL